ncbi:MAG: guanylate kinase, partial [Clostridia bacterium]|nr:guanylate kinase [Clostridia bacterium]
TGKGTVCDALLQKRKDIAISVSCTTRAPRPGEVEGVSYHFVSESAFKEMLVHDEFLEHASVYGNYYGTPTSFVSKQLELGYDVLLEIDVQGALKAKRVFPEGVYIFLLPPSMEELENRIRSRGTEKEDQIVTRLSKAKSEAQLAERYDYVIVNDVVDDVVQSVECILAAERLKVSRNKEEINF